MRPRHPRAALAASPALVCACGVQDSVDPPLSRAQALDNAPPADGTKRPWAAFVTTTFQNGETEQCSGALIAPNLVLTSAHCTICASSVVVKLLGDGIPLPLTVYGNAPSGISTLPGSTSSAVNCASSGTALDTIGRRVAGRALGLVRLNASSAHPPLPVLTTQPTGFSPVQDLAGTQTITVVSRGATSLFADPTTMREGQITLDQYTNEVGQPFCRAPLDPFFLAAMAAESSAWRGDEGGAWLATVDGTEQLIGITTSPTMGIFDEAFEARRLSRAAFRAEGTPLTGPVF